MPVERIDPNNKEHARHYTEVVNQHLARYDFALEYCQNKTVADITCGTGYGSEILSSVAKSVDKYDKELLCDNKIIDLEKEAWDKKYDVIVSFETIEHLENPEFFLQNLQDTCDLLILSTPIDENLGDNPYHKQVWKLEEFKNLIEKYFYCEYFSQNGIEISKTAHPSYLIIIGKQK